MVKENTMQQTEIGSIPEDWEVVKLGKGVSLLSGHHILAQFCNTEERGIPYLTGPSDFSKGYIEHTKYTERPSTICQTNDILITVKGSGAGTMILADAEYCISRQLMAIRTTTWDVHFVYSLLKKGESLFEAAATGLIPGLSRTDILEKYIPVPPLPEQQAIAEALSDTDTWITSLEDLIAKKRLIKQGAMQELLTPKEGWEVKKLGEVGKFFSTNSLSRDKMNYTIGEIYNIHYGDIHTIYRSHFIIDQENVPYINPINSPSMYANFCKPGDLVIADASENEADIGKAIEIVELNKERVACGLHTIHFRPTEGVFAAGFIGFLWQSFSVKYQILKEAQGTKVLGISTTRLQDLQLKIPSVIEQTRVVSILSDMDTEIEHFEQKLAKARQIKQGMMQELLTGRVRLV